MIYIEEAIVHGDVPEVDNNDSVEDGNTSFMFHSYDDPIDPNLQTPGLKVMKHRLIVRRSLDNERKLALYPWFVGLARCPKYIGDAIEQPRVRPLRRTLPRMLQPNQHHRESYTCRRKCATKTSAAHYLAARALATSKIPYLIWPLVNPAGERHILTPSYTFISLQDLHCSSPRYFGYSEWSNFSKANVGLKGYLEYEREHGKLNIQRGS